MPYIFHVLVGVVFVVFVCAPYMFAANTTWLNSAQIQCITEPLCSAQSYTRPLAPGPPGDCLVLQTLKDGSASTRGLVSLSFGIWPRSETMLVTTRICGIWLATGIGDEIDAARIKAGNDSCGLGTEVVWFNTRYPRILSVRRVASWSQVQAACASDAIPTDLLTRAEDLHATGILGLCPRWVRGTNLGDDDFGMTTACGTLSIGSRCDTPTGACKRSPISWIPGVDPWTAVPSDTTSKCLVMDKADGISPYFVERVDNASRRRIEHFASVDTLNDNQQLDGWNTKCAELLCEDLEMPAFFATGRSFDGGNSSGLISVWRCRRTCSPRMISTTIIVTLALIEALILAPMTARLGGGGMQIAIAMFLTDFALIAAHFASDSFSSALPPDAFSDILCVCLCLVACVITLGVHALPYAKRFVRFWASSASFAVVALTAYGTLPYLLCLLLNILSAVLGTVPLCIVMLTSFPRKNRLLVDVECRESPPEPAMLFAHNAKPIIVTHRDYIQPMTVKHSLAAIVAEGVLSAFVCAAANLLAAVSTLSPMISSSTTSLLDSILYLVMYASILICAPAVVYSIATRPNNAAVTNNKD